MPGTNNVTNRPEADTTDVLSQAWGICVTVNHCSRHHTTLDSKGEQKKLEWPTWKPQITFINSSPVQHVCISRTIPLVNVVFLVVLQAEFLSISRNLRPDHAKSVRFGIKLLEFWVLAPFYLIHMGKIRWQQNTASQLWKFNLPPSSKSTSFLLGL